MVNDTFSHNLLINKRLQIRVHLTPALNCRSNAPDKHKQLADNQLQNEV